MRLCTAFLTFALSAVAGCSVGGVTVSLAGGHERALDGAGESGIAGSGPSSGGGGSTATGSSGGTLNLSDAGITTVTCPADSPTSVTGLVYDPAGNTPLYNAVVYVPSGPLPAFQPTVACEKCTDPVKASAVALTDATGRFELTGVPDSTAVDLVVQLGKWRRKRRVPISPCMNNKLSNPEYTRLPQFNGDGDDGVGDIPKIALSTGHSDALECLLRKIGIRDSEFTTAAGNGRVNLFVGCVGDNTNGHFGTNKFSAANGGASFPSTNELFDSGNLNSYDVLIFSCEGHKCPTIQTPDHVAQLVDFANRGGRVYLDHDHYNWLNHANAPIESAAEFSSSSNDVPSPLTATINTSPTFPKGVDFANWLVNVGASQSPGSLQIFSAKTSVTSIDPNRAQSWIYSTDPATADFFYFTIGTPVAVKNGDPAPEACGRVVFTDLHVSKSGGGCVAGANCGVSDDLSDQDLPFPTGCTSLGLMPQEKALEFMIFDLSSCVQKETDKPVPPAVIR